MMAFDVGQKNIGVAITDALGLMAHPRGIIKRSSLKRDLEAVEALIRANEVEEVVVGLPVNMNGSYGPQAQKALEFMGALRATFSVPIHAWDERLSTVQAQRALREVMAPQKARKNALHSLAAQLILQSYLEAQRKKMKDADGKGS